MNVIDLVALLSFATLVISWAILPANGFVAKQKTEERAPIKMAPISES